MLTQSQNRCSKLSPVIAAAALFSVGTLANVSMAHADMLINMNFYHSTSNYTATAPTGTSGAIVSGAMHWNNLGETSGGLSGSDLKDTNGNATTIGLSGSGLATGYHASTTTGVNAMLYGYPSAQLASSSPSVVTLTGLDAAGATTYNLYVYNWWNYSGQTATTSITEAGGTLPAAETNTYTGSTATEGNTFTRGVNYVLFTGLKANASGDIQVSAYGTGALFNGLQLDVISVPESSSLGLLGLGGAVVLLVGRKHKSRS